MNKAPQSIVKSVTNRIYGHGRGSVFTPNDFLDLGSRRAVDLALHRLTKRRTIRRLARGLYLFPKQHPLMGEVAPAVEQIAKALQDRDQVKLQPSGAYAANLLGLSEQVPAKVVFLTSGRASKIKLGRLVIEFRATSSRKIATAGRMSGLVISALRYLGKHQVATEQIARLRSTLSDEDRARLLKDLPYAPAWMHARLRAIAQP